MNIAFAFSIDPHLARLTKGIFIMVAALRRRPTIPSTPISYLWDDLAVCACRDPKIITKERPLSLDIDLAYGPHDGATLTWNAHISPLALICVWCMYTRS